MPDAAGIRHGYLSSGVRRPKLPSSVGRIYRLVLACEYCDYVLEVSHQGPNYERKPGVHQPIMRCCPNDCSVLVPSLR